MSPTAVCDPPAATALTLAQLLTRAHEEVRKHGAGDCPVCGGVLRCSGTGASCGSCGSRLS